VAGDYDLRLVALSVLVATFASFTALNLAGRVSSGRGSAAWIWLLVGAVAMGTGIWSMHFIGMLAFRLPIPMAYDTPITMLSMLIAIALSGLALLVLRRPVMTMAAVNVGAVLMGVGISFMHYTGMAAMKMSPPIEYDPPIFIASVIIAVAASLAALFIAFQLRQKYSGAAILAKLGSAVVMGLAITGMHYTGMAAARFAPESVCLAADSSGGMENANLAVMIGLATMGILVITLVISAFDAHFAARTAKLADSLQAANEQLRGVALHDRLTGLPNRFLLDDRLEQALARAARNGKRFALMYVDLDKFKPVNDSFGHHVGDGLLMAVAQRLSDCVRKQDTVARTGGDEFVIVLSEIAQAQDASMISGKVLRELSRPFDVEGHRLEISCSIGISVYPDDGKDLKLLTVNADAAMYHAKKAGRNNYRFFAPEMRQAAPRASA
jgi:diguanylate cyclase (GGDEF)-like protein